MMGSTTKKVTGKAPPGVVVSAAVVVEVVPSVVVTAVVVGVGVVVVMMDEVDVVGLQPNPQQNQPKTQHKIVQGTGKVHIGTQKQKKKYVRPQGAGQNPFNLNPFW